MDSLLSEFLSETHESLDVVDTELVEFERHPDNAEILADIFRLVHTIKGTCGFLGLPRLAALAHAAETLMGQFRDGASATPDAVSAILKSIDRIKEILARIDGEGAEPEGSDDELIGRLNVLAGVEDGLAPDEEGDTPYQALERPLNPDEVPLDELERVFRETPGPDGTVDRPAAEAVPTGAGRGEARIQTIRVAVETLEDLMTLVSELVLTRNQLLEMVRRFDDSEFKLPLQRLSSVTAELQEGVMKTRMQPIGNAWQKLPRIVRDLAGELGKKIELETRGAETELDRQVLELIRDPLTHMVRNSADHGIETPGERTAVGKGETGRITLSAFHEGGYIIIGIADDGRGLAIDRIRDKAVERGLTNRAEANAMSPSQVFKFIFAPGFSTAEEVTSFSGRGVGMDVVRNNIEVIGGSIEVASEKGRGSTFTIKIPLTLAIVQVLIVEVAGQRFAVPQLNIVELVRANTDAGHLIERINTTPVLRLRDRLLPLIGLATVLGLAPDEGPEAGDRGDGFIVVTQAGNRRFGIVVDRVFDTEEIVVKPMSTPLREIAVFSGNTILGDGSVIMIVDPNGIARQVSTDVAAADETTAGEEDRDGPRGDTTPLLVFSAGSSEPRAVPLALVTRLERIETGAIEHSGGREMVQYRGQLMPLVRIAEAGQRPGDRHQPVLVFSDGRRTLGLAVDRIIDIVDEHLAIELNSAGPGCVGTAVIDGRATGIVDVGYYIARLFDDWGEAGSGPRDGRDLLLIDDSEFFRDMLAPVLEGAGYRVTAIASAAEAIGLRDAGRRFDMIVCDTEMPGLDGFELARRVRSGEGWGEAPIVALSARADAGDRTRGREAGFADIVGKFDREALIRAVTGAMKVAA